MKISVGILARDVSSWQALLRQIGVPSRPAAGALLVEEYSAVIVADDAGAEALGSAREYLRAGGAVLCSGTVHALLTGRANDKRPISYLVQDGRDGPFPGIGIIDISAPCAVPAGAQCVRAADGRASVAVERVGEGALIALPFDAPALLEDRRCTYKSFWMDRRRLPFEYLSRVSRGGVRKITARALELLHHTRGLPFLHLWHFPGEARSLFALRIDTDYGSAAEIESLSALLRKNDIPATWFVHVGAQRELLPRFAAMKDQEIGVHCFEHKAFLTPGEMGLDLEKAEAALRAAGISFEGYAGPFGRWSMTLAQVLARRGFEYSSEFSYDYDDLPSFPSHGGRPEPVLQVPVHPMSIGSLRRQGCTPEEMRKYFADAVTRLLGAGDPLFFYHHPKNLHPEVLEGLFSRVREEKIETTLLGEYARWWKVRSSVAFEAELDGGLLRLSGAAENVRCRMTLADGTEAWAKLGSAVETRSLSWTSVSAPLSLPARIGRIRKFNPWIPLNRLEDAFHRKFLL